MRILLVHNRYKEPGGEDIVFGAEADLLRARGHDIQEWVERNADIDQLSRVGLAAGTIWSVRAGERLRSIVARWRPEIVHFHNTFPLISPSAYVACKQAGLAVVQTLHNYRLICPNGLLLRNGRPCEDCVGRRVAWPGVLHACYHHSRPQTAVITAMLAAHQARGTWDHDVDVYVALTQFARRKFVEGGLPEQKIMVKPNFVEPDPGVGSADGGYFLYAGRLSEEKGLRTLLRAWARLGTRAELRIAGGGPLEGLVQQAAAASPGLRYLGHLPRAQLVEQLHAARALVFPSEWYEGMPVTVLEALACGLPVIATRLGATAEIVAEGETGLFFGPGDADGLACMIDWASANLAALTAMGRRARQEFEVRYTAEANYRLLLGIYQQALDS